MIKGPNRYIRAGAFLMNRRQRFSGWRREAREFFQLTNAFPMIFRSIRMPLVDITHNQKCLINCFAETCKSLLYFLSKLGKSFFEICLCNKLCKICLGYCLQFRNIRLCCCLQFRNISLCCWSSIIHGPATIRGQFSIFKRQLFRERKRLDETHTRIYGYTDILVPVLSPMEELLAKLQALKEAVMTGKDSL